MLFFFRQKNINYAEKYYAIQQNQFFYSYVLLLFILLLFCTFTLLFFYSYALLSLCSFV